MARKSVFANKILHFSNREKQNKKITIELFRQLSTCLGGGKKVKTYFKEEFSSCETNHIFENSDMKIVNFLKNEILYQGFDLRITSGYRCDQYNFANYLANPEDVRLFSLHCTGQAVDFIIYRNGKALTYEENLALVSAWKNNQKYQFSPADFAIICVENKELNLSKHITCLFYVKVYRYDEGRDADNRHRKSYIHIDFRGIRHTDISMWYYHQAGLLDELL